MIRSYLINLKKDEKRLAFFSKRFTELGLIFERVDAIDGRTFSEEDFQDFQDLRPKKNPWGRGQMGCFLSHFRAWEQIANGEEDYSAIFEDDVHISQDLKLVLDNSLWIPTTADIIRLETSTNRVRLRSASYINVGVRKAYKVRSTTWCTGAYILSKKAAKRLIALPSKFHQPSDVILFNFENSHIAKDLEIFQFHPAFCTQDKYLVSQSNQFASNIESDVNGLIRLKKTITYLSPKNIIESLKKTTLGYIRISFR